MTDGTLAVTAPAVAEVESYEETMTIVAHLGELRRRIIVSLLFLVAGTVFGWFQARRLIHFLAARVGHFVFFQPTEAFFAHVYVALAIGLTIASPIILAQLWLFLVPGLLPKEAQFFKRWVPWVVALFVGGMVFGYFVVYPVALHFFLEVVGKPATPMMAINVYLGFIWTWILPFGLMFELPLALVALRKLGIVDATKLRKNRKIFFFAFFVLAVFICPSEIVLQFLIALPLAVLFELSLPLVARIKPLDFSSQWEDADGAQPEESESGN